MTPRFDARPIVVAIAGPNGAGKSTFHQVHLAPSGLLFVNADHLARELKVDPYEAARLADRLRRTLVEQRLSFVFETVFSDPVGEKLDFLRGAQSAGYTVVLCFIGIDGPEISEQRVSMRVMQGGHDVPTEKIFERYPRSQRNLSRAIQQLEHVLVFDNGDMADPFRRVAEFERGKPVVLNPPVPAWLTWT